VAKELMKDAYFGMAQQKNPIDIQKKTTSFVKRTKEYGVLSEMVTDVMKIDEFRYIQNESFQAKEYILNNKEVFNRIISTSHFPARDKGQRVNDYKQQIEFIQN
jgi:hypothetical protein